MLGRIALFVGFGLILVGILQVLGFVTYRSLREPVPVGVWFGGGAILTVIGYLLSRPR